MFYQFLRRVARVKTKSKKIKHTEILSTIIEKREKILINNPVLLSAIYLYPRFNFLLNSDKKKMAQDHLIDLAANINFIDPTASTSNTTAIIENVEEDELTAFLNSKDSRVQNRNGNDSANEIISFEPERMVDHSLKILIYWEVKSKNHPLLGKLAKIVFVVPATQCSVERSFSALASILTYERTNITSENLENIMQFKLNYDFS